MITISDESRVAILRNAETGMDRKARELLLDLMDVGLAAAEPKELIRNCVKVEDDGISFTDVDGHTIRSNLKEIKNVYVIGPGKANGAMAEVLEEILVNRITEGEVIIHEGDTRPYKTSKINLNRASLPLPNAQGMRAAKKILEIAKKARENDLVICLISGGGSPLMPLSPPEILLKDKSELTRNLSRAGANIKELNIVRKHLSLIKGGRLAKECKAHMVSLILSDVVGDDISSIASGPTSPDSPNSTFKEAVNILKKYDLWNSISKSIKDYLTDGIEGKHPETPKESFPHVRNIIIGNNRRSITAILQEAEKRKLNTMILSDCLEGEAREIGRKFSEIARSIYREGEPLKRHAIVIAGGETTVTVRGSGQGGRNQELALCVSLSLYFDSPRLYMDGVAIGALASDGKEAFTDAAGAIVDGKTARRAKDRGLDPLRYLSNNDSNNFFKELGDLLITDPSPSGTNVNDFVVLCVWDDTHLVLEVATPHIPKGARLDRARLIGNCTVCGAETLYCCYGGCELRETEQRSDHFLHFCSTCHWHTYEQLGGRMYSECGADESSAICPFCGFDWS
jgi:glycerate 2-kinase